MLKRFLAFLGLFVLACAAPLAAQTEKRVALVIGNSDYAKLPALKGADQDAAAMAAMLQRFGFKVASAVNLELPALRTTLAAFQRDAAGADAILVFYAGHALRYRNAAYLVPVGATLRDETSIEWDTLPLKQMLDALPHARSAFLVIDGCGQSQLAPALSGLGAAASAGFAEPPAANDMFVVMSTSVKDDACEQPSRSSLLPRTLLTEMQQSGLDASQLFERVNQSINRRSGGRQYIEFNGVLPRAFVFGKDDFADQAFRRLGADPSNNDLRAFASRYADTQQGATARDMLAARDQGPQWLRAAGADPWRGLLSAEWRDERQTKARAARYAALEGRWNREDSDRAQERAAIEKQRLEQEQIEREKAAREEQARQAREREEQQRKQAELQAAEQRRQAQEKADREKAEQENRARLARELEEQRRRQAEAQAAEQKRQEQERVEREKAAREEQARLAREREEQQRKQAELQAAEQRRLAQEKADREKAEQEALARAARQQEERARLQAELDAAEKRKAEEQQRLALASPPNNRTTADPPVGGQAVDEANRFTAEQRRLAQERLERDRRARGAPSEFTTPLQSETGVTSGAGTQIASLPPTTEPPRTTPEPPLPKPDTPDFIKATQEELKRLGCYAGIVHGRMNNGTKSALESAGKKIGDSFKFDPQTEEMLRTLKSQKSGLCGPIACGAGQVRRGDICVASRPPVAAEPARPVKPAPRPQQRQVARPQPATGSSGGARGGCFNFNGRQYCQ
ncbi:caspase family protein [Terrarubrum flagellatum]|uniref:caspase family protein n=1 Tax=Terrirubrum flagellatum TaxID=2895980 RepID=UPI003145160B